MLSLLRVCAWPESLRNDRYGSIAEVGFAYLPRTLLTLQTGWNSAQRQLRRRLLAMVRGDLDDGLRTEKFVVDGAVVAPGDGWPKTGLMARGRGPARGRPCSRGCLAVRDPARTDG
jgi:hypothetical protein